MFRRRAFGKDRFIGARNRRQDVLLIIYRKCFKTKAFSVKVPLSTMWPCSYSPAMIACLLLFKITLTVSLKAVNVCAYECRVIFKQCL